MQSQVKFNRVPGQVQQGSGEGSGKGLRGFGAEPGQVQQDLGGLGAEPGQVRQGSGTTAQNAAQHWYNEDVTGRTATYIERKNIYI